MQNSVAASLEADEDSSYLADIRNGAVSSFNQDLETSTRRSLFVTENLHLGVCNQRAMPGDLLVTPYGGTSQ
jgi:hypothetical protein